MYNILVDLSFCRAELKYSGIPQDSRLIYKMLSNMEGVAAEAFAFSLGANLDPLNENKKSDLLEESRLLSQFLTAGQLKHGGRFRSYLNKILMLKQMLKKRHTLNIVHASSFPGFMWNIFLKHSLEDSDLDLGGSQQLGIYTAGAKSMLLRQRFRMSQIEMDANGHDFVVFQDFRPVKVRGARKIIRFHDAIPIFFPQFVDQDATKVQKSSIVNIRRNLDAWVVCNSKTSAEQLLSLVPELEGRVGVAYCLLPEGNRPIKKREAITPIIGRTMNDKPGGQAAERLKKYKINGFPPYMIAVSTIEPRKNYLCLIRAWEDFCRDSGHVIPLVIVGSRGWMNGEELKAMAPYVEDGSIFHLHGVPVNDLRILYSNAELIVAPSFTEGFGLPPLEAMQCGCPALVSDIPAHREIMGEAAWYFNPYSITSLRKKLNDIFNSEYYHKVRDEQVEKGFECAKKYSAEAMEPVWMNIFDRIVNNEKISL